MLSEIALAVSKFGKRPVHSVDTDLSDTARNEERFEEIWQAIEAEKWSDAPFIYVG